MISITYLFFLKMFKEIQINFSLTNLILWNVALGTVHFLRDRGGWWNFLNPHYELPWPRPLSPHFFSCPPPPQQRRSFSGGDPPPFKRDIIVIKPHMHIFCSVQYDLYFLFNVKLLTTHSTDVAATSVNSKNIFCPFAKALLHYFSKSKSQFPIFRLWIFQSVSLLASQLLPRHR